MESGRVWRIVITAGILILAVGLLYLLRNALTPVFIALLLAYLLNPLVNRIAGKHLSRTVAILILGGTALILITTVGGLLVFQVQREVVDLTENLPQYLARVQEKAEPLALKYLKIDLPRNFTEWMDEAKNQILKMDASSLKPVTDFAKKISSKGLTLFLWFFGLLIVPVLLIYFLRDWESLKERAASYFPLAYRDYLLEKFQQVDEVLAAFIRGQLTVCIILGLLYSIGLLMVGVNMAVVIGMVSGLALIIPYFGTAVGIVAGSIMSLLENGFSWQLVGVWVVFAVAQTIESYFITPKIVGKKVGLSPVAVILAILIGVDLLGFFGILVAVPAAAVLNVFIKDALQQYRHSKFFLQKPPEK